MPRFKASNPVTGEEVYFDWSGSAPPTQKDIKRISDEQRTSRIAAKQKVADAEDQRPFMEKLMSSGPAEYLSKAFDVMGLDQPWHPIDSAKQIGAGVSQMVSGQGPEQHPRVAGAVKAVHGALGMGGPPLTALGLATVPVATLGAMTAGNLATRGAAAVEPDDWSPEVKDATSTAAGLVVGGLTGHALMRKTSPPITTEPKTGEPLQIEAPRLQLPPPIRPERTAPPETGVNWATTDPVEGAPQLSPSTGVIPPGRRLGPGNEPIVTPPPDEPQVVSSGDPRTTPQPLVVTAPPQAGPRNIARPVPSVTPPIPKAQMATPPMRSLGQSLTIQPPDTSMFESSLPEEDLQKLEARPPQQDLSSQMRPEPTAPSQVSTVQPARPVKPPVKPLAPPLQSPQVTPPPVQAPPPLGSSAQGPGAVPAAQPPAGPPPVTQQPQVQAPQDLARAALARAQRPQPPMGPTTPPPAPPPVPISQRQVQPPQAQPPQVQPPAPAPQIPAQPQVQPPIDLKAALARGKQPAEPEIPELSPAESFKIAKTNQVLEMLKKRRDVTVDQIQRVAGTSGVDTKAILNNLQKRGLISGERGKYNYLAMSREELTPDTTPDAPEQSTAPPSAALSPYRQQRIHELQQQMGQAEDEGDDIVKETLRNHLQMEERNAKIEQNGTPEQKAQVQELDGLYQKIKGLEDKEEDTGLNEQENQDLANLYRKANSIEQMVSRFWKDTTGQAFPEKQESRGFFARLRWLDNNPAAAKPRDISAITAEFRSQNQVLRESSIPAARKIGTRTPEIQDLQDKFIGTYLRRMATPLKGLSRTQRLQVGKLLDTNNPLSYRGDPNVIKAAAEIKSMMDEIWTTHLKKNKVGRISDYFPHIESLLDSTPGMKGVFKDIWDYHTRPWIKLFQAFRGAPVEDESFGDETLQGQRGVGRADSPFAHRRTDSLDNIEFDPKKVLPVYIESIAKYIYTKPWLEQAADLLSQIPEDAPVAREYAKNYLRYYARYGEYPTIQSAWDAVTGPIMRMTGRSLLFLDPRLAALHLGRLAANIYQGVPTKYIAYGVGKLVLSPLQTFDEIGRLGMLPGWRTPWTFQRPMAKLDNIGNFLGAADFIPDAIAYHGLAKMYRDQGFSSIEASRMAVAKTKDLSLRVDPARMVKLFTRDLGPGKPFLQFKHVVTKIAEQYATMPLNAVKRRDYAQLMRFLVGAGSMLMVSKKLHLSTWHFNPLQTLSYHAAAYDRLGRIAKKALKGDIEGAMIDAGILATPGASQLKSEIEKGKPSLMEQ